MAVVDSYSSIMYVTLLPNKPQLCITTSYRSPAVRADRKSTSWLYQLGNLPASYVTHLPPVSTYLLSHYALGGIGYKQEDVFRAPMCLFSSRKPIVFTWMLTLQFIICLILAF